MNIGKLDIQRLKRVLHLDEKENFKMVVQQIEDNQKQQNLLKRKFDLDENENFGAVLEKIEESLKHWDSLKRMFHLDEKEDLGVVVDEIKDKGKREKHRRGMIFKLLCGTEF